MVNGLNDYEYQNDCVEYLFDKTTSADSKNIITVKAPTGAGKTVILIKYVNFYLNNTGNKVAFIWLCPGKGDLEVQSREKMEELMPSIDARDLPYSMLLGFDNRSVTFVNWELVTNKKNNALKDSERKNIYDRIDEAHNDGIKFILIIDEEHLNNTKKAKDIIDRFDPIYTIRVSATANKVSHHEFYEIPEDEVIDAGLITRAIYVNEGVMEHDEIDNDYDYLLDLADMKRKELLAGYEMVGADVRPLVLIQFPSGQPETIKSVEDKLASMGYTYDNGLVNIWMSDDKIKNDDLTANNGTPAFLLMKQAVSTGWDCPRAKILVKLREGGSEDFQIQTIGRIRRMPERKHYDFPGCLDLCYIYTLDEHYKQGLMTEMDKAYQVRKLFLKSGLEDFTLTKEMRNLDTDSGLGERELLKLIYEHFMSKYKLGTVRVNNRKTLSMHGYNFSHEIDSKVIQGEFRSSENLASVANSQRVAVKTKINTHTHGIQLMHNIDEIKKITAIPAQRVRNILQRLFRKGKRKSWKLLSLETSDFYAFIINNIHQLKEEFREIMSMQNKQLSFTGDAKTI
ncbi:MAG: DEAD/DEAH box helicase family protein [Ruminococcus sp.]|nr:DEAD/DEAH box helicase family protein [Ruminococcus sp.]